MNNFIKKVSIATLSFGLVAGSFATTTFAAESSEVETSTTLEGGSLSINEISIEQFGATTLSGATQDITTTINPFTVVDATGTGSGWNLSISATQLTTADGLQTLPENSLSISAPTIEAESGSSEAGALENKTGVIDSETGVKFLTAETEEGMGTFNLSESDLNLKLLPKETKAGTYTSTITFNLVTGP
ncbi:WxL domain-containing protein [Oceanobacillus massiliensis]|uniref:WxL domain-containing protein n=1 Tax=Oceanobacillus massiliensis TaxID=1465765 RepID=UPI0002886C71|nr:WxL domain-containing protein [Oceanobacillus massiliensis]